MLAEPGKQASLRFKAASKRDFTFLVPISGSNGAWLFEDEDEDE